MAISTNKKPSPRTWSTSLPPALQPAPTTCDLSAVIACYNEEESIGTFHRRLAAALESSGRSYELIFVNDGSEDDTLGRLLGVLEADPKVSAVVDLYSNAGQANATTPGIMLARGAAIRVMDSDLQLDPEELPKLLEAYDAGYDIVTGYRRERHDSSLRRVPSAVPPGNL